MNKNSAYKTRMFLNRRYINIFKHDISFYKKKNEFIRNKIIKQKFLKTLKK